MTSGFYFILGMAFHIVRLQSIVSCIFLIFMWFDIFAFKSVDPLEVVLCVCDVLRLCLLTLPFSGRWRDEF